MVEIALTVTIGILLAFCGYQMRVIDRLTDKVMAKDYREYKQFEKPVETVEIPKHKSLGWADDIPDDEEELQ